MSKILTIIVFLGLCSQAFAENAITHVALADTGVTLFNTKYQGGGYYRHELDIKVEATDGTAYLIVDNKYTPGLDIDVWLSSDGENGLDGGDVEMYVWALPEQIALSAGAATTVVQNYVYLTYNGGSPALKRHAAEDQIGDRGDALDSMIFIANAGLGAVSGADEQVRYFNIDQPSLYKNPLRTTLHGHHPAYHEGIAPTIESKSFAATRGFLHSGTDVCLIPSVNTDDVFLYVPVYNDSNYAQWDSLDNFAEYADGDAIGVPHYFWIVIWGAISKDTTEYKLYMNIQAGTNTYLTRETAEQDKYNMIPTDIPSAFHTTGFLIAGVIIQNDEVQALEDGSTYLDLRGFVSGTRGGGGAPPTDSAQIDAWNFMLRAEFDDSLDAADYLDSTNIANQGLVPEDLDTTDNDFVFFNAFRGTSANAESVYVTIETIEDSLAEYLIEAAVQAEIGDSLAEYLERAQFKDSLDAANYLDSTNIASQGIVPDDIDTTDNDFVFEDIFRGTSAQAESTLVTIETIEDSLARYLERVEFNDSLDAATYLDSTNIANQGITPDDIDTTDNDFVFNDVYRGMSSQAESVMVTIETIEDSLARYLERVEFNDSLDVAAYLDSTNVANQGLIPEDVDTTDNDFVFSGAFRGMSSQAESTFVTIETIEDSLAVVHDLIDNLETDTRYLATIYGPNSLFVADSILVLIDTRTLAAITVTRIDVTCDADPTTELDFDLLFADAFIGQANQTVIDDITTTSGTTTITSGFDDATVPAEKCVYIRFNAEPDADIIQVGVRVTYTID